LAKARLMSSMFEFLFIIFRLLFAKSVFASVPELLPRGRPIPLLVNHL
jgi:hypothetical protein